MKIQTCFVVFSVALFALVNGCISPPQYPIEPQIEYIPSSMTKDTLYRAFPNDRRDTTYFSISFTDGDGDIGDPDKELQDLYVIDNRDGHVDSLRIPYVPELGASNGINGEMTVRLFTRCCIFPPPNELYDGCVDEIPAYPYDKVDLTVYMIDRAGHQSNLVELPPIYLRCFE